MAGVRGRSKLPLTIDPARAVAEGVETVEQARALRAMGCDLLQGFLFARPMPTGEVERFLDRFTRAGSMAGDWLDAVVELANDGAAAAVAGGSAGSA